MALPLYLAMTQADFRRCGPLPQHPAWFSAHFSPYGAGLTNLPDQGSGMTVILDDSAPIRGHDARLALSQLARCRPERVLLDFQRPPRPGSLAMARALVQGLSCPVALAAGHAEKLRCPVLLPPVPPDTLPEAHLAPWAGREIWLEVGPEALELELTAAGAARRSCPAPREPGLREEGLCCHYTVKKQKDAAVFTLWRTREDTHRLLEQAEKAGARLAVGFYGEWERENEE